MKNVAIPLLAALCLTGSSLRAQQTPWTVQVPSNTGQAVQTPVTDSTKTYVITISGTYSLWPEFTDCTGADALYVYNAPASVIAAGRFPAATQEGKPFFVLPRWFGDTTEYSYPGKDIRPLPLYILQPATHIGLRLNGEPIAAMPYNSLNHTYQIRKKGTGDAWNFEIVDKYYSIAEERPVDAHSDNCGTLTVRVEEEGAGTEPTICDLTAIKNDEGKIIGIRMRAAVNEQDSTAPGGLRNLLSSGKGSIAIVENDKFIDCSANLVCDSLRSLPVAVGIVFDRSGSMNAGIDSITSPNLRLIESQKLVKNFISNLNGSDSVFFMTFSNDVTLDQDWIDASADGKAQLDSRIDAIITEDSTAFNKAVEEGISKLNSSTIAKKILLVITDGINNRNPLSNSAVLAAAAGYTGDLYVVGLALGNDSNAVQGKADLQTLAARAPRGRYFDVSSAEQIRSLYDTLSTVAVTDDCCTLFFTVEPCEDESDTVRTLRIVFIRNSELLTSTITYRTDCAKDSPVGVIDFLSPWERYQDAFSVHISPNPVADNTTVTADLPIGGRLKLTVSDVQGMPLKEMSYANTPAGIQSFNVSMKGFAQGMYFITLSIDGIAVTKKALVVR